MRAFSKLSIRTQVLAIGVILLAVIPLVSIVAFRQSSEVIVNQNTQYNMELVSNLKQRVSDNYAKISGIMINLGYDTTVQDFLAESDNLRTYELSKKVNSLMGVIQSTNPDISDIIIVNASGKHISLTGKIGLAQRLMDKLDEHEVSVEYGGFITDDPSLVNDSFLFGMNLFASLDTYRYGEKIGFIAVVLDAKSIQSEIEKFPRLSGTSFYLRTNGQLAFANAAGMVLDLDKERLALYSGYGENAVLEKIGGKSYAIQSFALPEINGNILSAVPIGNLIKELKVLKRTSYIMLIVTLVLVTIPYTILMMNILKPLGKLIAFMKRLKSGNLEVLHSKVELEGYAEIEVISTQFNTMLNRINDLTQQLLDTTGELYQVDIERQRAEMSFLQSQINPHFLSNTLDAIKGIAIVKGNRDIYEMTAALSRMLRYSIKGTNEVTLEEELKIIGSYITIHQGRFPGRIEFEQYTAEELHGVLIPKMIIQPIVENALIHGLEPHASGGKVVIQAVLRENRQMEIIVTDNGVGMELERLEQLRNTLRSRDRSANQHIGIKNVNDRVRLHYGKDYGIEINSWHGNGTMVRINLPILLAFPSKHHD
ncbi:sensor histidine kinase [Paenibacillus sp. LHD-117]|uniref:sensor histidine kinase n=1 Tax=Paenibacillus sp. LHD-117 TaxID=3071412 RepID=UPI0027DF7562|nr:sensor histidine kinase [Paenibacillus sp. LHD-117]MDQ6422144.1 sensor histidine kinase [Paenibacillus sp. LHD-117]